MEIWYLGYMFVYQEYSACNTYIVASSRVKKFLLVHKEIPYSVWKKGTVTSWHIAFFKELGKNIMSMHFSCKDQKNISEVGSEEKREWKERWKVFSVLQVRKLQGTAVLYDTCIYDVWHSMTPWCIKADNLLSTVRKECGRIWPKKDFWWLENGSNRKANLVIEWGQWRKSMIGVERTKTLNENLKSNKRSRLENVMSLRDCVVYIIFIE